MKSFLKDYLTDILEIIECIGRGVAQGIGLTLGVIATFVVLNWLSK